MKPDNYRKLIWTVKAFEKSPSRKRLNELAKSANLFDDNDINKYSMYQTFYESFEKAEKYGYAVVCFIDDEYPENLKSISTPPPVLFVRGNTQALNYGLFAGIVGSRDTDAYGIRISRVLARELADVGVGIISGGARGVDTAAHNGALDSHGVTVAVMGCGLDIEYPKRNMDLFEKIVKNGGAVISEFPFGTPPFKKNFPKRNRIIAAMAEAVMVTRAAARSGSLITADHALGGNKAVFAVPGNIDEPLSAGTNRLIADGAMPVLTSMDIIDELIVRKPEFFHGEKSRPATDKCLEPENADKHTEENISGGLYATLSDEEKEIVLAIEHGFCRKAEIEEHITFGGARFTAVLGILELKGVIKRGLGNKFKITSGGKS